MYFQTPTTSLKASGSSIPWLKNTNYIEHVLLEKVHNSKETRLPINNNVIDYFRLQSILHQNNLQVLVFNNNK